MEDDTEHPNCLVLFVYGGQKLNSLFCQPGCPSAYVTSLRGAQGQVSHTLTFALTDKSSEGFANCHETGKFITANYQDFQSSFVCL